MREYFLNSKWKIVQLVVLLFIFLLVVAYINGKSVYEAKLREIESAKQTFGN